MRWLGTMSRAGRVRRWHTLTVLQPEDVAQHSYRCALIARHVAEMFDDVDTESLVMHMLIHDVPELGVGDIPYSVKQDPGIHDSLERLEDAWVSKNIPGELQSTFRQEGWSQNQKRIAHLADQVASLMFIQREVSLGNSEVHNLKSLIEGEVDAIIDQWDEVTASKVWRRMSDLI